MPYASIHRADVERYVDNVLSGVFVAGKQVRWACERYRSDLIHAKSRGYYLDEEIGDYAIDCFSDFKHTTGQHRGIRFELYLWQKFIVWNLWAWRRKDNGMRRFRKAFITVARGNGKSPLSAAIGNILAFRDIPEEARAQVFCFATKEEQAKIVWDESVQQLKTNIDWRSEVDIYRKEIRHKNGSILSPKGSDSQGSDGWNLHGAVIDELHAWTKYHRKLFAKVRTAMGKRKQPLQVIISTEGDDQSEIYIEEFDYCEQVVCPSSTIEDDQYFVYIAQAERYIDCKACTPETRSECEECNSTGKCEIPIADESYWPQANPMLVETSEVVDVDHIRGLCREAEVKPTAEKEVRQYHLNQRETSSLKAFSHELWGYGNAPLRETEGRRVFLGFDWGWKDDLASLVAVFPDEDETYDVKAWVWCPEETKARSLNEHPWAHWREKGWLRVTDGNTTDTAAIFRCVEEEVLPVYQVAGMAFDGNNAREFGSRAVNDWGLQAYPFPQNCKKYNEPTRQLMALLSQGRIRHGGNPLLAWCANNVILQKDSDGYVMPKKEKSAGKIDPICALIMGLSESMFCGEEECSFGFDVIRA